MSEFIKRTLTGILFVAIILSAIYLHRFAYFILFLAIVLFGLIEFYQLACKLGYKPQSLVGTILGGLLFILSFIRAAQVSNQNLLLLILPIFIFPMFLEIFRKTKNPAVNIAFTYMGLIYVAIPFSLLTFIAFPENPSPEYNPELIIGYLIILWSFDTFAYLTGKLVGRHKMFETMSPGKTWEGFTGGLMISVVVSLFLYLWFNSLSITDWITIAIIISITGTLGDLLESAFKRSAGVKDSGRFLPGHGGILDRFDSALLSIPFVYFYIHLFT